MKVAITVLVMLQGHAAARSLSDFFFTASFSNPRSYLQLLVRRSHLLRCPVIQEDVNALHVLPLDLEPLKKVMKSQYPKGSIEENPHLMLGDIQHGPFWFGCKL